MVFITKIVPYDNQPTDKMHVHVHFTEERAKYHRSCEVVVFLDKKDPRTLDELKEAAVEQACEYLEEILKERQLSRKREESLLPAQQEDARPLM